MSRDRERGKLDVAAFARETQRAPREVLAVSRVLGQGQRAVTAVFGSIYHKWYETRAVRPKVSYWQIREVILNQTARGLTYGRVKLAESS